MRDLKVIGLEDGALVAATDEGERFRIVIDDVLQSHVRRSRQEPYDGPKISPREVQAHIRAGMSSEEVARLTGAPVEYVRRYEGPVIAEREHIVGAALSVPVVAAIDPQPDDEDPTFGSAIRSRLAALDASDERWTSWKEDGGGWIVKLAFTASEVEHDARWSYEPKKQALAPLNAEAITLSKQGEMPGALIPRLRAVESEPNEPDDSRFDSGAFTFSGDDERGPRLELATIGRPQSSPQAAAAAINRAEDGGTAQSNQTADLLEALRKRRGERESAHHPAEANPDGPNGLAGERSTDVQLTDFDSLQQENEQQPAPQQQSRSSKRGRPSMPSWDEIVFGAKSDDD